MWLIERSGSSRVFVARREAELVKSLVSHRETGLIESLALRDAELVESLGRLI